MSIDTGGSPLHVLVASAVQDDKHWKLRLPDIKEHVKKEFHSTDDFNTFVSNLRPNPNSGDNKNGNELVLFIKASATNDDFLVVGRTKIPERNLLKSLFEVKGYAERRVLFFINNYRGKPCKAANPNYTILDPSLMQGVTLHRLSGTRNSDIPIDRIKEAAFKDPPKSAVDFYRKLLGNGDEMQIAMVPSGRKFAETAGNDFALLLVDIEHQQDLKNLKKICSNIASIGEKKVIDVYHELDGELSTMPLHDLLRSGAQLKTEAAKEFVAKFCLPATPFARIWLLVSLHGNENGIFLYSKSNPLKPIQTSLKSLTGPLFLKGFSEATKILIIDACRGEFPPDPPSPTSGLDNQVDVSKLKDERKKGYQIGLLFRNEGSRDYDDPWSISGLKPCLTLFGSIPGFKAYKTDVDGKEQKSILFKAIKKSVKELESPEEMHAFVQRTQWWENKLRNQSIQLTEKVPGESSAASEQKKQHTGTMTPGQVHVDDFSTEPGLPVTDTGNSTEPHSSHAASSSGVDQGPVKGRVQVHFVMHSTTKETEFIQRKRKSGNNSGEKGSGSKSKKRKKRRKEKEKKEKKRKEKKKKKNG